MSNSLYITSVGPESGRILVVLGLFELLTKRMQKVAFFRPVVRADRNRRDSHIGVLRKHYRLEYDDFDMYGVTDDEARAMLRDEQEDQLLKTIFTKYKNLQARADFVLCEGADFGSFARSIESDFNSKVASNLGTPILMVLNEERNNAADEADILEYARDNFIREGCSVAAIILNFTDPAFVKERVEELNSLPHVPEPVFVIPEDPDLKRLTLADIAEGLSAKQILGTSSDLTREIYGTKIAAMRISNFLDYVTEGCLVVVPGDRHEIVISSLLASASDNYPNVSGILLTGGLLPAPSIQKLIDGVPDLKIPILSVQGDTFSTATELNKLRAQITVCNERKIASALNLFETFVDGQALVDRIAIARSTSRTPIMFEYELVERAKSDRKHIVLPEGSDERILRAVEIVRRRNAVDLTILGDPDEITKRASSIDVDLGDVPIIDPLHSELREKYAQTYFELRQHKGVTFEHALDVVSDISYFGTLMVYCDDADGMVSGAAHTTQHTIRPSFETIKTKPGVSVVSSVFLMCLSDRVVVFGDCAVNPTPNPQQLAEIAVSSAETAEAFDIEARVALLSYSTGESGKGDDVEKVREAVRIAKELRPDLLLEGPLQFDAAFDPSVAAKKAPDSDVAGRATVFIFPDLNTGNNTYKAVQRTSGAVAVGPVLQGLKRPVNDLSRGCTVTDIVNTVVITAVQAQIS